MGFSSIAVEQREKEENALRSFLAFSLIGSVALHIVVLVISSLWVRTPELAEEPIEVMVVDPPSLQAAKPKEKTKSVAPPNLQAAKPEEKTKSKGGSVARGGSNSGSGTKSQGGSGAAGDSSIDGGSRVGETAGNPPTLPSQPTASATAIVKRDAIASIAPSRPPAIFEEQPTPVDTLSTRTPVETLKPKLESPPKPAANLPPASTLQPLPTSMPNPAATLPPEKASEPQPVSTPSPSPTATPETKPISQPSPVPVAQSPSTPVAPTQPPQARQQVSKKVRDLFRGQTNSTTQEIAGNGARQSDKPRGVDDHSSVAAGSGNRQSSGSTRGSGTRDSGQSTGGSGSGNGSGTGGSGSGNGSGTGGNGSGNGNGNDSTTGSGSGSVTCRSCPEPKYPPGAEKLEGRAVVVINVDRDGNVRTVQIAKSTGHDILDQRALETVKKKWKLTSSENGGRVSIAVNFARQGSVFHNQALERERLAQKRERLARKLEQQRARERLARKLEQQRQRERLARKLEQQRQRERLNRQTPAPVPETRETPTTPSAPMPE